MVSGCSVVFLKILYCRKSVSSIANIFFINENCFMQFTAKFYRFFQRKITGIFIVSDNSSAFYFKLNKVKYNNSFTGSRNLIKRINKYEDFILSMDVSRPKINKCVRLQNVDKDDNNMLTEHTYFSDHEQSSYSDIEPFGLNMLFDVEKVVNEVKLKLKGKKEKKKMQQTGCHLHVNEEENKGKKLRERKNKRTRFNQCSFKDDQSSDSSFYLQNLFEQKKTVHKKKKAKKAKKIVKDIKSDDSYGLEMLFSEKNISEQKNKRRNRKRKLFNHDSSETNSQDDKEDDETKVKRKRPNHFVAIRVLNPKIHLAIKDFQDALLKENEKLKPALIPLVSLHITMAIMHLDETVIKIAQNVLETCKIKIMEALETVNFKLTFSGVGNFNNEVLFAKVAEENQTECLKIINNVITSRFEEEGICLSDKKEWKPHLTLLKLSRKKSLRKQGIKKVKEDVYGSWKDSYFGEESVQNIHLCCMTGTKEHDGFYKCLSTTTFSFDSKSNLQ